MTDAEKARRLVDGSGQRGTSWCVSSAAACACTLTTGGTARAAGRGWIRRFIRVVMRRSRAMGMWRRGGDVVDGA